ncbi:hypothetical protein BT63DRAFT_428018 [Microthyrium microscopicum]|uniref:Uncharacterized protein n=1 Tax=Microthyrium microscopicum TaxID=703497 RepID=A0A6A6U3S5_9PEZI|nr:hypothetical protein BT63DRAFT_428018 [Microthyrium microscopicum]
MSPALAERDTNTQLSPPLDGAANAKPKSLEYHRAVLESQVKDGQYVKPSARAPTPSPTKPAGPTPVSTSEPSKSCTQPAAKPQFRVTVKSPEDDEKQDEHSVLEQPRVLNQVDQQTNTMLLLANRLQNTYISPSDTIQSPATQKLAAFKNKHMGKGMKGQTLFAKTVANNAAKGSTSGGAGMFGGDLKNKKTDDASR